MIETSPFSRSEVVIEGSFSSFTFWWVKNVKMLSYGRAGAKKRRKLD